MKTSRLTLPVTMAEYHAARERVFSEDLVQQGLDFRPLPSDVIISSFSKSGTTWLQQIVHGLRTRGSMDFPEISSAVPWLITAGLLGIDLNGPQDGPFRAFKSHFDYERVPKGGRYIVSFRDPYDVAISFYHFMEGWFFEPGRITLADFTRGDFLGREGGSSYWGHLASWWRERHRPEVLLLTYEFMKADLPAGVRRIARFLDLELDPELERIVLHQSSYPFMRAHVDQFDDHILAAAFNRLAGLPNGNSDKVREGKSGEGKVRLDDDLKAELDDRWRQEIAEPLGLPDYPALMAALAPANSDPAATEK